MTDFSYQSHAVGYSLLKFDTQPVNQLGRCKSLARLKPEYCSTNLDPKCFSSNTKDDEKTSHTLVDQLEMVQRRPTRWVTGRCHNISSVLDMQPNLDGKFLNQRHVYFILCMLYKILDHLVATDEEHCSQRCTGRLKTQYIQLSANKSRIRFFPEQYQVESAYMSYLPCRVAGHKTQLTKIHHSRFKWFPKYFLSELKQLTGLDRNEYDSIQSSKFRVILELLPLNTL